MIWFIIVDFFSIHNNKERCVPAIYIHTNNNKKH